MTWINRHLRIVTTFADALTAIRSDAAGAERSRLGQAGKIGEALKHGIAATLGWDQHLAAAKARARRLGGREGRGFAEVEARIDLAVDDGLRDARRG
jgi:hypothetical protein